MALTRSENMARIRGRDTAPELALRRALWARGLRYRVDFRTPGGRADIAVPAKTLAVFIDGCFWHGCPEHYVHPRSHRLFWDHKLRENVERDQRQTRRLLDEGWTVIRLWEHEVQEDPVAGAALIALALLRGGRGHWPRWRVALVEPIDPAGVHERRHLSQLLGEGRRQQVGPRTTAKAGRVRRPPAELSVEKRSHK